MTNSAFLSIRNLGKNFGPVKAVGDITLEVPRGEFLTFLGPSGSGKSTTLYAVAGILEPSVGDILLEGRSILGMPSHKRNIGMVFQRYTLFMHLTVGENIAFPLRVRRRPANVINARVDEMLALVRLDGYRDRMPATLSGGQQQRVALARALAYDPPILLMDEPLSALDKKLRDEIQQEIKRVHKQTGVTILYVTHDQEEALRLSDRIALFNDGRIEQIGSGVDLYNVPLTRFCAAFMGNSNFLKAKVENLRDGRADARFPDATVISSVPVHGPATSCGDGIFMVRPENIQIHPGSADTGLPATITDVIFLGDCQQVTALTGWGENLSIRSQPQNGTFRPIQIGDAVRLTWGTAGTYLFL
jgi:putative spermidine/putrescine transport system ATP-binding protein